MAVWMAYALLLATLFGLAGVGLEAALRAWRLPVRWAVGAGILASVLVPLLPFLGSAAVPSGLSATLERGVQHALAGSHARAFLSVLDRPLAVLWALSVVGVLMVAVAAHLRLRRLVRRAERQDFEGIGYRCTPDFGPAVVGLVGGVIVLPSWATSLEPESLRLALRHEMEHVRARDLVLQLAGALLTALQPWNLALWWQLRRLRHAIEMDCDRRLLSSGVDPRAYMALLCDVVARRATGAGLALALGTPRSRLARRMDRLADSLGRRRTGEAATRAALAASLATVAILLPFPQGAPTAPLVRAPRAIVKLELPGQPGRPDSLVTVQLEGADAVRALQALPGGTPEGEADGRVIRRIIRTAPPPER